MNLKDNTQFDWRDGGFRMEMESEISSLIKVKGDMICITKKAIRSIITADIIDPQKINPNVRHSQQIITPYGSDNNYVGGILQQAHELFKSHVLPKKIDCQQGVDVAFDTLIKLLALQNLTENYILEEDDINRVPLSPKKDGSLEIPFIKNLQEKIKDIIKTADHSILLMIELVRIFYPEIRNKKWCDQLAQRIKSESGEDSKEFLYLEKINAYTALIRDMRNKIEHPDIVDILIIDNYKITSRGIIKPRISFKGKSSTIEENLYDFLPTIGPNILMIFQNLMAILCKLHIKPMPGTEMKLVEISPKNRKEHEKHVKFRYQITIKKA